MTFGIDTKTVMSGKMVTDCTLASGESRLSAQANIEQVV